MLEVIEIDYKENKVSVKVNKEGTYQLNNNKFIFDKKGEYLIEAPYQVIKSLHEGYKAELLLAQERVPAKIRKKPIRH